MPSLGSLAAAQALKGQVHDFWNSASCGENAYAIGEDERERLNAQARARYELEPYILDFAKFHEGRGKDVLEVGVGMGADHLMWARSEPRSLSGIDLTERAIDFTKRRLGAEGFTSDLRVGDAERLPFEADSFDIVYSYGVLHHTPDTWTAIAEVERVLRRGGTARIMLYHRYSMVGYMLWTRYALMKGRPLTSLTDIYAQHLESPGTKAFTAEEVRDMMLGFCNVECRVQLGFGDLLEGEVGQRHRGPLLTAAKALYPRGLIKKFMHQHGLALMIEARK